MVRPFLILPFLLCCCISVYSATARAPDVIQLNIGQQGPPFAEKNQPLKLTKPDTSVLHPNIQVISFGTGTDDGFNFTHVNTWTPTQADIQAAEDNLYLDHANLAAVRVTWDAEKEQHVAANGVVDGIRINEGNILNGGLPGNRSDSIDLGIKLTPSRVRSNTPSVVEVLVVCDKEWGDLFKHDRRRILDYFTVYFWDVSMRYKTLRNTKISFAITGIIVLNSPQEQSFIEQARGSDGRTELNRILYPFGEWIYSKMSSFPKFDIAVAITNSQGEWNGGLGWVNAACGVDHNSKRHWGTSVWHDDGAWGSVAVGAHEIGHNLGTPHNHDDDEDCKNRGFQPGASGNPWSFSLCSDYKIGEFVKSEQASCLRHQEEPRAVVPTHFSGVLAPSMDEQCKRRLKSQEAFFVEEGSNCETMKCQTPDGKGWWVIYFLRPVDNSPCKNENGEGRCFRGRCRNMGHTLRNVGTRQCAVASNPFSHLAPLEMTSCHDPIEGGTPLDQFALDINSKFVDFKGIYFKTPWATPDAKEQGDKCIYTGHRNGDWLWTDRCNLENDWQSWELAELQMSGKFMLKHVPSGRCAKAEGRNIPVYDCNPNEPNMWWEMPEFFIPMMVVPG